MIDATAEFGVTVEPALLMDVGYPVMMTLSLGPEGKEEAHSSTSAQDRVVFCSEDSKTRYLGTVELNAACKRDPFFARVTLRHVTLDDPEACEIAGSDGILPVRPGEFDEDEIEFSVRKPAWDSWDCGDQFQRFDLEIQSD